MKKYVWRSRNDIELSEVHICANLVDAICDDSCFLAQCLSVKDASMYFHKRFMQVTASYSRSEDPEGEAAIWNVWRIHEGVQASKDCW